MAESSLREKFKLLRQWQMQQQNNFRLKTKEGVAFPQKAGVSNDDSRSNPEDPKENPSGEEFPLIENEEVSPPVTTGPLHQRMTSNSLQQALLIAMNQLNSKDERSDYLDPLICSDDEFNVTNKSDDEISNSDIVDDNLQGNKYMAYDMDGKHENGGEADTNHFLENFNRSLLTTSIFQPNMRQSFNENVHSLESEKSDSEENENEIDGFHPISYSEDNLSEKSVDIVDNEDNKQGYDVSFHHNLVSAEVPFDDKPIQSNFVASGAATFDDLIEMELRAENEKLSTMTEEKKNFQKKSFLRKGQGTARFKSDSIALPAHQRSALSKNTTTPVAKATLKLKPSQQPLLKKPKFPLGKSTVSQIEATGNDDKTLVKKAQKNNAFYSGKLSSAPSKTNDSTNSFGREESRAVDSSIEASFQKLIEAKDVEEMIADEELAEFELLEQVAIDTSVSSHASSMLGGISQKARNTTSSPVQKETDNHADAISSEYQEVAQFDGPFSDISEEDPIEILESDSESSFSEDANETVIPQHADLDAETNANEDTFSDEVEWTDANQKSNQIAEEKSAAVEDISVAEQHEVEMQVSSPPTSKFMKTLFPKLRGSDASKDKQRPLTCPNNKRGPSEKSSLGVDEGKENKPPVSQNALLKTKLAELDTEISRFKNENAQLEKLRIEREKELKNLQSQVEQFKHERSIELDRIEKFRTEEMQNLKRERKMFDKYQKAIRSGPSKKEREEIEAMKQQIAEIQDDLKRRENKWNGAAARFRTRIQELENENFELKETVSLLEKERLQRWFQEDSKKNSLKEDTAATAMDQLKEYETNKTEMLNSKPTQQTVPRKVKSILKKNGTLASGNESGKQSQKVEGVPRKDILPLMQPEDPELSDNMLSKGNPEELKSRLSLTPERQSNQISKQDDSQIRHLDGKVERILSDGSREIEFPNGTKKTIDQLSQNVTVSFFNGDVKQMFPDGRTVYFYAESKTTHTSYKDGAEVFEFSNGQSEKHFPDGRKVITFNDETVKCIFPSGAEETVFADGTIQNVDPSGKRTISFPNGQREIHTENYKRREYPDGTMKTVYQDGRQETRYSSGRVRVKNQAGDVIVDTGQSS